MDSKIFQSPLEKIKQNTTTHDGEDFFFSGLCVCLDQKYLGTLNVKNKHPVRVLLPQPLVYVKFGVQSCLKINTCVCSSDLLCGFQQGKNRI